MFPLGRISPPRPPPSPAPLNSFRWTRNNTAFHAAGLAPCEQTAARRASPDAGSPCHLPRRRGGPPPALPGQPPGVTAADGLPGSEAHPGVRGRTKGGGGGRGAGASGAERRGGQLRMPVWALPAGEKRVRVPGGDTLAQTPFRIQPGPGVVIIVVISVGINYYRPRSPLPERRRRESSEVRMSAGQEELRGGGREGWREEEGGRGEGGGIEARGGGNFHLRRHFA